MIFIQYFNLYIYVSSNPWTSSQINLFSSISSRTFLFSMCSSCSDLSAVRKHVQCFILMFVVRLHLFKNSGIFVWNFGGRALYAPKNAFINSSEQDHQWLIFPNLGFNNLCFPQRGKRIKNKIEEQQGEHSVISS